MSSSLIPFPSVQEQADDVVLQAVFKRQCEVSLMVEEMAERLYLARSKWIGGGTIPWSELTVGRKLHYRQEVEALVKKAIGEK